MDRQHAPLALYGRIFYSQMRKQRALRLEKVLKGLLSLSQEKATRHYAQTLKRRGVRQLEELVRRRLRVRARSRTVEGGSHGEYATLEDV